MSTLLHRKGRLTAKGAEEISGKDAWLVNDDIRPLKLGGRTWTLTTYLTFWFSATATVSNWYLASSGQALGLSMWESTACMLGGNTLIAIVIAANGRVGAVYHIGYPVVCRAAFGVFGAWWPTFNRAVMAIVWNGVNAVQGGQCVYVLLHALTPSIATIPNIMGPSSALDSAGLISLFVFWVTTSSFLVIPTPKMKNLVYAKLIVFVVSAIAMLAWTLTLAGGIGAVARQPGTVTGAARTWLLIRIFLLGAGNYATFASNAADFQRYAKRPNDVLLGNLVGFPLSNFIVAVIGNLVASSSQALYGDIEWNPVLFLDRIQTENYTAANRAGCFFIAAAFTYCAIFSSIFENSIPAGNDIAALLPKWMLVRKGFFVCQVFSVAINPWYLLAGASVFVNFLASYQIFLSAITGVLLCHYYIVARGQLRVEDLFTGSKSGEYFYFHGWNWRAYLAYVIGIAPNFYGFLKNLGVGAPVGVTRAYYFAYEIGLVLSFGVNWAACWLRPSYGARPVLGKWLEPKDYVRPEESQQEGQGEPEDASEFVGNGSLKCLGTTAVHERP